MTTTIRGNWRPNTATAEDIAQKAASAIDIFRALGVNTRGSRVEKYERTLRKFAGIQSPHVARACGTTKLAQSMLEMADFVEIASLGEKYLSHPSILPQLKLALKGREFRSEYAPDETDPHRDAAFELSTAAYLNTNGALGDPPSDKSDVYCRDGEVRRPIECKRIASVNGLKDALRAAKRQIRTRVKNGAARGLIVVDISRAVNPNWNCNFYKDGSEMSAAGSGQLFNFMLNQFPVMLHRDVIADEVLGAMVRITVPGFWGNFLNVRRYVEWTFAGIHDDPVDSALFDMCAIAVGATPTRPGFRTPSLYDAISSSFGTHDPGGLKSIHDPLPIDRVFPVIQPVVILST